MTSATQSTGIKSGNGGVNILLKLIIVVIAAIAIGALLSPYVALNEIKIAIHNGDAEKLSGFIDFPSVREGFKSSLDVAANRQLQNNPSLKDNPLAQISVIFGTAIADSAIDALVSPRGVASLLIARSPAPTSDTTKSGTEIQNTNAKPKSELGFDCKYESINQFGARIKNKINGQQGPYITLSRTGLFSWQITKINLQ